MWQEADISIGVGYWYWQNPIILGIGYWVTYWIVLSLPSDRVLATFYRLSIVTMSPSAAFWPQFSMECCKWSYLGNCDR